MQIQARVRKGFSVRFRRTSRPSVLFVKSHRAKIPPTDGVVPGSRSAVKARSEVCTPTTEVYRAKGKYAGSDED